MLGPAVNKPTPGVPQLSVAAPAAVSASADVLHMCRVINPRNCCSRDNCKSWRGLIIYRYRLCAVAVLPLDPVAFVCTSNRISVRTDVVLITSPNQVIVGFPGQLSEAVPPCALKLALICSMGRYLAEHDTPTVPGQVIVVMGLRTDRFRFYKKWE